MSFIFRRSIFHARELVIPIYTINNIPLVI